MSYLEGIANLVQITSPVTKEFAFWWGAGSGYGTNIQRMYFIKKLSVQNGYINTWENMLVYVCSYMHVCMPVCA